MLLLHRTHAVIEHFSLRKMIFKTVTSGSYLLSFYLFLIVFKAAFLSGDCFWRIICQELYDELFCFCLWFACHIHPFDCCGLDLSAY